MEYKWVLSRYRSSDDTGKKVIDLANANVGYHIINKERAKNEDVIVAFKSAMNKPLPAHLEFATTTQSEKLELWDKKRNGKR